MYSVPFGKLCDEIDRQEKLFKKDNKQAQKTEVKNEITIGDGFIRIGNKVYNYTKER